MIRSKKIVASVVIVLLILGSLWVVLGVWGLSKKLESVAFDAVLATAGNGSAMINQLPILIDLNIYPFGWESVVELNQCAYLIKGSYAAIFGFLPKPPPFQKIEVTEIILECS